MQKHFGAVEADFQSHYRLDLREVLWGPLRYGVRRIWALVSGLPHESALVRASLYGGRTWSNTDELLATLVEMSDQGNRMYFGVHKDKNMQLWAPVEIDRPWKPDKPKPEPRKQATASEMREAFGNDIVYDYREGE